MLIFKVFKATLPGPITNATILQGQEYIIAAADQQDLENILICVEVDDFNLVYVVYLFYILICEPIVRTGVRVETLP